MKKKLLIVITCTMLFANSSFAQDTTWVRNNTWYFDNFSKDTLPWSLFRETFIGIAPEPAANFDNIFYNSIYRTELAKEGHCYGMCVTAMLMMKNGGYLGYCHPPYVYSGIIGQPSPDTVGPSDPHLKNTIGISHGFQITHGFLAYLLDVIAIGKNRDGRHAFQQVNYYLAKNDPPVISVTQSLSPADGGHVLIPYYTEDNGANKKIYVYDPNRSYYDTTVPKKDYYKDKKNFIEVNGNTGAWSFVMSGNVTWSGSPGGGGNLLVIPLSIAGRKDRVPQSLIADGAYAINTIFIFGEDVTVEQMTDPGNQRRLLNDVGKDWETREHRRLKNVLPHISLDGATIKSAAAASVYFVRGSRPLDIKIRARGPYRIGMLFGGKYIEYKGIGNDNSQYYRTPGRIPVKKQPAHQLPPQINIFHRLQ